MGDYVTLLGAEQVQNAASYMRSAAEEMTRAATWMEESLQRQRNFMDDWLARFEQVLNASPDRKVSE
jgi:hypothetical protein